MGGRGTGTPIRAAITALGPILLSKVLDLTNVRSSSLNLVFHYADTKGPPLLDLKDVPLLDLEDLRSVIRYLSSDADAAVAQ